MLDEKEIRIIEKEIDKGKSNYRIGKERGHSANTIGKTREIYEKTKASKGHREEEEPPSVIDTTEKITDNIDSLIQTGKLNTKQRREWEKRKAELREILREEVDERIATERADAAGKKDQEWNKVIERDYVGKGAAILLQLTIQARDETIQGLRSAIEEKDEAHLQDQTTICNLNSDIQYKDTQIQNLCRDNTVLRNENGNLHNYIDSRLDNEVRQGQEQLKHDREMFTEEKKAFTEDKEKQQTTLNNKFCELERKLDELKLKQEAAGKHETQLAEREVKVKKREDGLEATRTRMDDALQERITAVILREKNVITFENAIKRWVDKKIDAINQEKEQLGKDRAALMRRAERQNVNGQQLQK